MYDFREVEAAAAAAVLEILVFNANQVLG